MTDPTNRKEKQRLRMATLRAKRTAAGICRDCGAPVTVTKPEKRGRGRPRTGYPLRSLPGEATVAPTWA